MALLHGWASLRCMARGRLAPATAALLLGVMAWWAMVFSAAGLVVSGLAAPVATPSIARVATVILPFIVGDTAHVYAPPLLAWPIPIDRTTFEDYQRAV